MSRISYVFDFGPGVHGLVFVMEQFVLFFLFLEFDELLLEHFFQTLYEFFVVFLNLGDFDFSFLQDIVFYFVAVALHGQAEPLLEAGLQGTGLVVFLASLLHLSQVFVLHRVLLPSVEKGPLMIFGVEEAGKILNLIAFFLNLTYLSLTFLFRMQ